MNNFIKVSTAACVNTDSVAYMCEYSGRVMQDMIKEYKAKNKLLDFTGRKKAMSVIVLKSGDYKAILSPVSVTTLIKRAGDKEAFDG